MILQLGHTFGIWSHSEILFALAHYHYFQIWKSRSHTAKIFSFNRTRVEQNIRMKISIYSNPETKHQNAFVKTPYEIYVLQLRKQARNTDVHLTCLLSVQCKSTASMFVTFIVTTELRKHRNVQEVLQQCYLLA